MSVSHHSSQSSLCGGGGAVGGFKEKALVTGGCGFIGSHLTNALLADREHVELVVVLDCLRVGANRKLLENSSPWQRYRDEGRLVVVVASYGDREVVADLLSSHCISHIYHLAATTHVDESYRDPEGTVRNNVLDLMPFLEECRQAPGLQMFFHMSTDEVLGDLNDRPADERTPCRPTNYYAATKVAAEALVSACHSSYGLPIKIIRANNVYGEGQWGDKVFELFCRSIIRKEPLHIHGSGSQQRNWLHVEDVVRGILMVARRGQIGELYHIGSRDELSIVDLARRLFLALSPGGGLLQLNFVSDRPHNDQHYRIDYSKIRDLGWSPQIGLADGISRTAEWYRNQLVGEGMRHEDNCVGAKDSTTTVRCSRTENTNRHEEVGDEGGED